MAETFCELTMVEPPIGYIKEGWDADIVVWDSHPLALGKHTNCM
jgi:imidazolonepropionase-like amidohydrolase